MKLWKENNVNKEWELSNQDIADRFIKSKYSLCLIRGKALVNFITAKDGLNSIWDWDKKKGSILGSKDMIEILDILNKEG